MLPCPPGGIGPLAAVGIGAAYCDERCGGSQQREFCGAREVPPQDRPAG